MPGASGARLHSSLGTSGFDVFLYGYLCHPCSIPSRRQSDELEALRQLSGSRRSGSEAHQMNTILHAPGVSRLHIQVKRIYFLSMASIAANFRSTSGLERGAPEFSTTLADSDGGGGDLFGREFVLFY